MNLLKTSAFFCFYQPEAAIPSRVTRTLIIPARLILLINQLRQNRALDENTAVTCLADLVPVKPTTLKGS